MVIVLSELGTGTSAVSFDAAGAPGGTPLDGPARFEGELRVGERIELSGRVRGRLRLECSRCLEPLVLAAEAAVDLRLVGDGAEAGPREAAMRIEDASIYHATGGRVDLGRAALELLELEVPQKPVCGPGCRGLCPACGENRNRLECACDTREIDPRLAPLLDLRPGGGRKR